MDFEKAYQNFIDGTATPEEVEFVRSEMKKASEINELLASVKNEGATEVAEKATVRKAIKRFWRKDILKTLIIATSALLVLAIGVACAIGIPILTNAKDNYNVSKDEAKTIAISRLAEEFPEYVDDFEVCEYEKELEVEGRIKNARYVHVFEIYNGKGEVYEIEVDSKTGRVIEFDD